MADLAIEPPVASAEPGTRAALRRARRIRAVSLGLGVLGVVLGAWLIWAGGSHGRWLSDHGLRVPATVTDVAPQRVNGGGNERGRVTFAFSVDGVEHLATNSVGGDILSYTVGEQVVAVVPVNDPETARLSTELDRPGWEVPGAMLIAGGLVALVWGGVRARALRRMRRCLDVEPWLAVQARLDHTTIAGVGGARAMGVLALSRDAGDDTLVVINRGLRRLGQDLEPLAWIAGWGTTELVVSPQGGGRPLEVRAVVPGAPDRAKGKTNRFDPS